MPLDTAGDGWARGEPATSIHETVLSFLQANDAWAFHARELADEVLDTDWELAHRREREIRRVGREEFHERLSAGEYDNQYEDSGGKAVADAIQTQAIIAICNALAHEGRVEVRSVPPGESNIPNDDWDEVRYFTWAGEE